MFARIRFFAFSFLILLIAIISCIHPTAIQATLEIQPDAPTSPWTRANPGGGGWFATMGAGPDGLILAASDLSGFYRSTDHGQRWDVIGLAQGLTTTHASAMGFHPTDPDILLLGTEEGVFRSVDRGQSVHQMLDNGYITDIELSASDPQIGYAAHHSEWNVSDGSVYKARTTAGAGPKSAPTCPPACASLSWRWTRPTPTYSTCFPAKGASRPAPLRPIAASMAACTGAGWAAGLGRSWTWLYLRPIRRPSI